MAGILITVGDNVKKSHEKALEFFVKHKNLRNDLDEKHQSFRLSKFSRMNAGYRDKARHEDISIWVVGTLIYKDSLGEKAIGLLKRDLRDKPIESLVDSCDGPFCMMIRGLKENGFRIVTDHAGIMNMYRYRSGQVFSISSSSMALSRNYPVTHNEKAIAQFLRGATVYGPATIYNEIELLEPASIYSYQITPEGVKETAKRYWQSPVEIPEKISFNEARDAVMDSLIKGFEVLSKQDVICDFTAGFDSRLVISVFSMFKPLKDIHTFVFGPEGSREVDLVKGYCKTFGFRNNHLGLPPDWDARIYAYVKKALAVTDGEENVFNYAPILWAQEYKSNGYDYSVNGLGGEVYRDFWWIQEITGSKRPANLDRLINTRVLQYEYDYSLFSPDFMPGMTNIKNILKHEFQKSISDMDLKRSYNTLQIDNLYFRQKVRRWAGRTISSSNQVVGSLTPLTMKRCVEAVLAVPPKYKRNGKLVKSIIERLSWPLSGLEMLNGTPCRNMSFQNAHRFMPLVADYGKRGLRKLVQKTMGRTIFVDKSVAYQPSSYFASLFANDAFSEAFTYDSLVTRDFYDREKYEKFYKEAGAGGFVYHNQFGNMLTLEMRMREDAAL